MKTYKIKKRIRPYRGKYKIPTHKHTPKRYRKSKYLWERFDGTHNWWPEIPLVTDLTKKPKGNVMRSINLMDYVPTVDFTDEEINLLETGFNPIKPHKLGIFENLKNWRRR